MSEENTSVLFVLNDREYTAEAAQTKIENADQHIKTIEEENAELRKKVDEYMEALSKVPQEPKEEKSAESVKSEAEPAISEEKLAELVERIINTKTTKSKQEDNLATVKATFLERYGSEEYANEVFNKKAQELGLSPSEAMQIASRSPKAVLAWFGEQAVNTGISAQRNTQGLSSANAGAKEGTWAWWNDLRQKDPKAYFSPQMARKRMQDAERLGKEGFFGKK